MQATDRFFFFSLGQQFGRLGGSDCLALAFHLPAWSPLQVSSRKNIQTLLQTSWRKMAHHYRSSFYSNDIWPDLEAFMATPVMKMRSMISNNEICFVASNIFYCYFIIKYGNSRFGYGETVFMNIGNNSLYVFTSRKEKRNAYFHWFK